MEEHPGGLLDPRLDAARRRQDSEAARAAAMVPGRWPRLRHWLWGRRPAEPLPAVLDLLQSPRPGRRGICCSGGGIRSAAFNLGALQALQARPHRILQRSDYLAAVSGGSYIAAGFAMVAKVGDSPHCDDSDPALVDDDAPPFHPGSPEEQYLRNRSNYMAPGIRGKTRLVARVVLGILLNLLFLGSLLWLLGWALGWVYGGLFPDLSYEGGDAETQPAMIVALAVLGAATALGLLATILRFPREKWARFLQAWAGRVLVLGLALALLFVALPELLGWIRDVIDGDEKQAAAGAAAAWGGTSAAGLLAGTLLQLRARLLGQRLLGQALRSGETGARAFVATRLLPRLRAIAQVLVLAAVGPALLGGIAIVAALANLTGLIAGAWGGIALVVALVVFGLLYVFGEVTTWSLHPFYRRRLSTAFALKRIVGAHGEPVAVQRDPDRVVPLSQSGIEPVPAAQKQREWPQLLVCAAANVSDPGATPPGRAVTSFTFSPTTIGGPLIGMVRTDRFEEQLELRKNDFALPAAVAMSGAALSPSMGKATRWPLRFLLTLANARLGVWVPNPRRIAEGDRSLFGKRMHWRPRASLLFNELLGRNSADAKFLYVTDGGHYENLGLVELLRRGCTEVVCFDASGGADVQELGDAIALARTELQVEIDVDPAALVPDPETDIAESSVAIGGIRYPCGAIGRLIYVRSVLTRAATHDIKAYHDLDPAFPHNSTGDQLYTDQRFEAYRKLGHLAGTAAVDVLLGTPRQQARAEHG